MMATGVKTGQKVLPPCCDRVKLGCDVCLSLHMGVLHCCATFPGQRPNVTLKGDELLAHYPGDSLITVTGPDWRVVYL